MQLAHACKRLHAATTRLNYAPVCDRPDHSYALCADVLDVLRLRGDVRGKRALVHLRDRRISALCMAATQPEPAGS